MPWNYIAHGFRTDCYNLLDKYSKSTDISFSSFAEVWRNMKFSYVYFGRRSFSELLEFTEEVFKVCKEFMFPNFSLSFRFGSIFLMYGLYIKQPTREEIKIRMTLKEWETLNQIWRISQINCFEDVNFIIAKLCCLEAFHFSFTERQVGPEKKYRKYYEKGMHSTGESITHINNEIYLDYDIIDEADNILTKYKSEKNKLSLPKEKEKDFLECFNPNCMAILKEYIVETNINYSPQLFSSNEEKLPHNSGENVSGDTDEIPWWQCKKKMPWWRRCCFNGLPGSKLRRNPNTDLKECLDDDRNTDQQDENKKSQKVKRSYNKKIKHNKPENTPVLKGKKIKRSKNKKAPKVKRTYNKKLVLLDHEDHLFVVRDADQKDKDKKPQKIKRSYNKKIKFTEQDGKSMQKENKNNERRNAAQQDKTEKVPKVKRSYNKKIKLNKLENTPVQNENKNNEIINVSQENKDEKVQRIKRSYKKKIKLNTLEDIQRENKSNEIRNNGSQCKNAKSPRVKRVYNKKIVLLEHEDRLAAMEKCTNEIKNPAQNKNEMTEKVKRTYNKKVKLSKIEDIVIKAAEQDKNEKSPKVKRTYKKKIKLSKLEDTSMQKEDKNNEIRNTVSQSKNKNVPKVKCNYNKKLIQANLEETSIQNKNHEYFTDEKTVKNLNTHVKRRAIFSCLNSDPGIKKPRIQKSHSNDDLDSVCESIFAEFLKAPYNLRPISAL